MNVNWFKNPDHVVYADAKEFVENFEKETGISSLKDVYKRQALRDMFLKMKVRLS